MLSTAAAGPYACGRCFLEQGNLHVHLHDVASTEPVYTKLYEGGPGEANYSVCMHENVQLTKSVALI